MKIKTVVGEVLMAKRRLCERCCWYKGTHRELSTIVVPRATRFIFTRTCFTQQRSWQLNRLLNPEGLPGLMLLNSILQISKWCQGQRLPLLKGNLRASFLPMPSRWHYTCRLEMFRKCFPLCNQGKHFLSLETVPTFFPSLKGIWCVFPKLSMTGPLHCLCSW